MVVALLAPTALVVEPLGETRLERLAVTVLQPVGMEAAVAAVVPVPHPARVALEVPVVRQRVAAEEVGLAQRWAVLAATVLGEKCEYGQ